jgi:[ribosomal protein S5]-alanine N-acetyltransferase
VLPIVTERLVLRDFQPDDWRWTHSYEALPEVVRYTTHPVLDEAASREQVERSIASASARRRRVWDLAVTLKAGDDAGRGIGRAGFAVSAGRAGGREAMLWYIFHPAWQGHGYATEACRALLSLGFDSLALHRVYADIDPRNTASVRVAQRLGMRLEAHHLENIFVKGEWCDSLIYALLARELLSGPQTPRDHRAENDL